MKKKLLNPRGYLSHTQIELWRTDPERYVRQYIHGEGGFENRAMRFGKKTSEALENGAEEGDVLMEAVVALVPAYKHREHAIRVPFQTTYGTVELYSKLDTFDPLPRFREYKTGKVPWTQAKVNKHRQMKNYAALIWLSTLKLPTEAWLDWIETRDEDGEVRFTGRIESFKVKITMSDVLEYLANVAEIAKQIDARYKEEMHKLT